MRLCVSPPGSVPLIYSQTLSPSSNQPASASVSVRAPAEINEKATNAIQKKISLLLFTFIPLCVLQRIEKGKKKGRLAFVVSVSSHALGRFL